MADALPRRKHESDVPPPQGDGQAPDGAIVTRLADVVEERVSWLWPRRAARGKLTLIEGDPGLGKSIVTMDVAASVTTGGELPGGGSFGPAPVVIMTAEDGLADTVKPRLLAAGGDASLVTALTAVRRKGKDAFPSLLRDVDALEAVVKETGAALVIIDPLMAFLGQADAHKDQDVRTALAPVAAMAERTAAAVIVVRHLNKAASANAIYRGGGSIGIIGAARAAFLVAKDADDEERRIIACVKNNLAPLPPALAYRVVGTASGAPRLRWERRPVEITADQLLAASMEKESDRGQAMADAVNFLRDRLSSGAVDAKGLREEAVAKGHSWRTIRRAQRKLKIDPQKGHGSGNAAWTWALPGGEGGQGGQEGHMSKVANVDTLSPEASGDPENAPEGEGGHTWPRGHNGRLGHLGHLDGASEVLTEGPELTVKAFRAEGRAEIRVNGADAFEIPLPFLEKLTHAVRKASQGKGGKSRASAAPWAVSAHATPEGLEVDLSHEGLPSAGAGLRLRWDVARPVLSGLEEAVKRLGEGGAE